MILLPCISMRLFRFMVLIVITTLVVPLFIMYMPRELRLTAEVTVLLATAKLCI